MMRLSKEQERSIHERHVNLMATCRLCRIEAGDQPDRLTNEDGSPYRSPAKRAEDYQSSLRQRAYSDGYKAAEASPSAMLGQVTAAFAKANLIVTVQLTDDEQPQWMLTVASKDLWVNGKRPEPRRAFGWGPTLQAALGDLRDRLGPALASALVEGNRLMQRERKV